MLWLSFCICMAIVLANGRGVIRVPRGSIDILPLGKRTLTIHANPPVQTHLRIQLFVAGGNREQPTLVLPEAVFITAGEDKVSFDVQAGTDIGRFYITYQLDGADRDAFSLDSTRSVILIVTSNNEWNAIGYQLALNVSLIVIGLIFFCWRRCGTYFCFWRSHPECLFEHIKKKQSDDMQRLSLSERFKWFRYLRCDGPYITRNCGINAALSLRFHLDCAYFFAILSIFGLAVLLPVNYTAGGDDYDMSTGDSYHRSTISNISIGSDLYWVHVVYCYVAAIGVYILIRRQFALYLSLQRKTDSIIGGRSVFIRSGIPPQYTKRVLRRKIEALFPNAVEQVALVHELTDLHDNLNRRAALQSEYERLEKTMGRFKTGTLSRCLVWLPGGVACPYPRDLFRYWTRCYPCRYRRQDIEIRDDSDYIALEDGKSLSKPSFSYERRRMREIQDQLAEIPIDSHLEMKCTGSAFVRFESAAVKEEFMQLCKKKTWWESLNAYWNGYFDGAEKKSVIFQTDMIIGPAPEPEDIKWENLSKYGPFSLNRVVKFTLYSIVTVLVLVVFSTPTAVLNFIQLNKDSELYTKLSETGLALVAFFATYLPALLLILVNWILLTFLFYLSEYEPWLTESARMRSYMRKGFVYLLLSSIVLPSIGVSALYVGLKEIESGQSYTELFLYNISGSFLITYVCQRAFLGSIAQLLRIGERLFSQPWFLSRAVTSEEIEIAKKPWPYYFGSDYSIILSIFMVTLGGSAITPIIAPFGALYFYIKFSVSKYNFVYVVDYTAGRGGIAKTAYSITFASLLLFLMAMVFILRALGKSEQVAAVILLLIASAVVGGIKLVRTARQLKRIEIQEAEMPDDEDEAFPSISQVERRQRVTYSNPYESLLALHVILQGMRHKKLATWFDRWKQNT